MPWIAALIVALLVALRVGRKRARFVGGKPRRESCILIIKEDESGNISLLEQPPMLRTSEKRRFHWFVVAECETDGCRGEYSIELGPFTSGGVTYDLFDSKDLDGNVPTDGDPLHLKAKLKGKDRLTKGVYAYTISVKRKGGASLRADSGDVEICP